MNLVQDHARIFRRNAFIAVALYTSVGVMCLSGGLLMMRSLDQQIVTLHTRVQQLQTGQDMQHIIPTKTKHLTHLFSMPLPGISFSALSLDESGMRIRGNARTTALLEAWLGHVSDAFVVETQATKQSTEKGLQFEVVLHEKF